MSNRAAAWNSLGRRVLYMVGGGAVFFVPVTFAVEFLADLQVIDLAWWGYKGLGSWPDMLCLQIYLLAAMLGAVFLPSRLLKAKTLLALSPLIGAAYAHVIIEYSEKELADQAVARAFDPYQAEINQRLAHIDDRRLIRPERPYKGYPDMMIEDRYYWHTLLAGAFVGTLAAVAIASSGRRRWSVLVVATGTAVASYVAFEVTASRPYADWSQAQSQDVREALSSEAN